LRALVNKSWKKRLHMKVNFLKWMDAGFIAELTVLFPNTGDQQTTSKWVHVAIPEINPVK